MNKKIRWILLVVFVLLLVGGFLIYKFYFTKPKESKKTTQEAFKLDKTKVETHLSKIMGTKGAYWQRMFELWWEEVETKQGSFDWDEVDERMKESNKMGIIPIVTIKPFANWDQDACHDEEYEADYHGPEKEGGRKVKVGKPCDMDAYADFLKKAVERYDGDGKNDMDGLTIPVKYWEIMNEPSMQGGGTGGMGEELKFFVGTSEEYLEILKISYETIKEADSEAKVLHAGMAGMQKNFQDFWRPVFENKGGDYFDIANIHTINTDERREDMYIMKFIEFLTEYNLEDKPIFVTETQFGDLVGEPTDLEAFENLIARSTIFALAQGADKLFFIENWLFWDTEKDPENKLKFDSQATKSSTHKVYLNLIDKLNSFDKIEVLTEDYTENSTDVDGTTLNIGHYKFIDGDDIVYVLIGGEQLPEELINWGELKVTDIYGETRTVFGGDSSILSNSPIFVENL